MTRMEYTAESLNKLAERLSGDDAELVRYAAARIMIMDAPPIKPDYEISDNVPLSDGRRLILYQRYWK